MSVEKTVFGTLSDGREAALYTLKNAAGMTLVVTPYGCRIIQLLVPDKDGNLVPVPVKVGDKVVYGKFGGQEIKVDGEDLLILRADDLYGVFE